MIGMAKSCSGGSALGNYVMDNEKGYELDRNLVCGETPTEIMHEMKFIQDLNQKATNKTFSLVLSPDIKDSNKMSDKELKEITRDYLNRLGIDPVKQQYVAFVHTEKEHKHVHIIANRVQTNGKLVSDHYIGKRAQWVAHDIAKERGLVSAKEKMFENIKNLEKNKDVIKTEIFKKHQSVMRDKPKSLSSYIKEMNKNGLEVKPTINKQGQIQGFRLIDKETKTDHKMSDISRSMSASSLIKSGLKNDTGISLDKTLQSIESKQIQIIKGKQQDLNISAIKALKNVGRELKPNANLTSVFTVKKEIKTKEDYQEAIKDQKFTEDVVKPNSYLQMDFLEDERLENIEKNNEYKNEIESTEDIEKEKSEKEIKQHKNELEI